MRTGRWWRISPNRRHCFALLSFLLLCPVFFLFFCFHFLNGEPDIRMSRVVGGDRTFRSIPSPMMRHGCSIFCLATDFYWVFSGSIERLAAERTPRMRFPSWILSAEVVFLMRSQSLVFLGWRHIGSSEQKETQNLILFVRRWRSMKTVPIRRAGELWPYRWPVCGRPSK